MTQPIVSLCLPTNGVTEWVFPVLDSIYDQNVENSLFEVIVTNNGQSEEFHHLMIEYAKNHPNLLYQKTEAFMFDNQLEALKLANGLFFKFVNHRSAFTKSSLQKMIDTIRNNLSEKPVIYFSNGVLKESSYRLNTFDEFIKSLGRYASWTTGVGIWREDYERIPVNTKFDKISPHSGILFSERCKNCYIIENYEFCRELTDSHLKKGTYDLFKAFAVEEFTITLKLYIDGDISINTLKSVKKNYKDFCAELYWDFCVRKTECSYKLDGFNDAMGIFYTKAQIKVAAYKYGICKLVKRIFYKLLGR